MKCKSKSILIERAIKIVIKEARIKRLLVSGLKETIKFIIQKNGYLCVLAKNCELKSYRISIKALCLKLNVKIVIFSNKKRLGRLTRQIKRKKHMKFNYKIIPCSSCLVIVIIIIYKDSKKLNKKHGYYKFINYFLKK
uniref:Ribosomal protein S12 n=1 Tax=Lotharella vacuolata TaxID=74820 RepID=A0A0H5BL99_9EUKA|nr:ribosomal protein S12 [Lotharella vacuolata]BAS01677.1 ribosomal protein S12 [Lotharella vacuolata]